jgi:hypothetical protein
LTFLPSVVLSRIMASNRKTFKPRDLHMCLLSWNGYPNTKIALVMGLGEGAVSASLNSPTALEIFSQLKSGAIDSMLSVQTMAQAIAPLVMEQKMTLALGARSETVRNVACSDILEMAGHSPIKRLSIERPDPTADRHLGKTERELREEILSGLGLLPSPIDIEPIDKEEDPQLN